jgi:hypothetical protein
MKRQFWIAVALRIPSKSARERLDLFISTQKYGKMLFESLKKRVIENLISLKVKRLLFKDLLLSHKNAICYIVYALLLLWVVSRVVWCLRKSSSKFKKCYIYNSVACFLNSTSLDRFIHPILIQIIEIIADKLE